MSDRAPVWRDGLDRMLPCQQAGSSTSSAGLNWVNCPVHVSETDRMTDWLTQFIQSIVCQSVDVYIYTHHIALIWNTPSTGLAERTPNRPQCQGSHAMQGTALELFHSCQDQQRQHSTVSVYGAVLSLSATYCYSSMCLLTPANQPPNASGLKKSQYVGITICR